MNAQRLIGCLLCCCLLLTLGGCGNKGPLVLPEAEEKPKKTAVTTGS